MVILKLRLSAKTVDNKYVRMKNVDILWHVSEDIIHVVVSLTSVPPILLYSTTLEDYFFFVRVN